MLHSQLGQDQLDTEIVAGYEIQLMFQPPVSHKPPNNWSLILSQPASEELTKLLNKGVLVVADPCTPGFYSHIFTIPKKSGEQQLIINLKNLYRCIPHVHFKMEGLVLSYSYRILCSFCTIG